MGAENGIERSGRNLVQFLNSLEVYRRCVPTDADVGPLRKRRFVDNRVHPSPVDPGIQAVFLREDVVDVYGIVEERHDVGWPAGDEITAARFHEERMDTFVRCCTTAPEREEPVLLKECLVD